MSTAASSSTSRPAQPDRASPASGAPPIHPAVRGRDAFLAGLLRPSPAALTLTLIVAALWGAALVALITPEWVASPAGRRLAHGGGDRDLRVTSLALALSARESLHEPAVFLLGASDLPEALTSSDDLERRLPPGTRVHPLYSGWQSLLDTAALVELLPKRIAGVAVVLVSPKRIAHGITYQLDFEDQPPFYRSFGFRSEVREEIAAREGVRTSPRSASLLLENYQFYLPRLRMLIENGFGPPPRFAHHEWTEITGPRLGEAHLSRMRSELRNVLEGYEDHRRDSLWMLGRILAMVEERGGRAVLLEAPMSPAGYRLVVGDELWQRYRTDITAFAEEHGVPYWDLGPELALQDADFRDDQHVITRRARLAFTSALAGRLAPLLPVAGETASLRQASTQ